MALPLFKDLTKSQDDLANKFFCHSKIAELNFKVKSEDKTELSIKMHQPGQYGSNSASSALGGESTLKYNYEDLAIEAKSKFNSDHNLKLELTPKKFDKDVKLILNTSRVCCGTASAETGSLGLEYKHDKATISAEYASLKEDLVNFSLVTGKAPSVFGLNLAYNLKTGKFNKYDFALKHSDESGNSALVLKHLSTDKEKFALGTFLVNYYQKINPTLSIVSQLTYSVPKNAVGVTLSSEQKIDDNTTVKSKVNSDGKVAALFRHALNKNITLNLSTEIDSKQLHGSAANNQFVYGMLFEFSY